MKRYLSLLLYFFAMPLMAAPGDILFDSDFVNNGDLNSNWDRDSNVRRNSVAFGAASPGLSISGVADEGITSKADRIDADVPGASLSFWARRGFDTQGGSCPTNQDCSEFPENNEDLIVEYLDTSNNWIELFRFAGGGTPGEIFSITEQLPDNALHAGLRIRFLHSGGNGLIWDFWHVDDIVVTETLPPPPPTVPMPRAEWRMDEDSWNGTADEVEDSSGNNQHGVAIGTSTRDGFICNGGDFSATNTTGYLSLANTALNGLSDFSISAWGRTTNNGSQALVSGSSGTQHNELIMWWPNGQRFQPFLKGSSGSSIPADINDGNWRHLVWTRQGNQNCLYIDGVRSGTCVTRSTAALVIANGGLIIAQEQDSLGGGFDPNQDWQGDLDELMVFGSALSAQQVDLLYNRQVVGQNWDGSTRSCPGSLLTDHYHITAASGVSCEAIDVIVTAHDDSHNPVDAQGATITFATSTGRGSFSPSSATFAAGQNSVTTSLRYADLNGNSSETISIDIGGGGFTETSNNADATDDPSITVSLSGLRFLNETDNSTVIPTQVAGVNSPQQLFVQAIQVDADAADPATAACVGLYPAGPQTLRMAGECKNPVTCQLSNIQINGNNIDISDDNGGSSAASFTGINLTFDVDSKAPITLNYADVGEMQLHVEDPVNLLSGASNNFVVRPYRFEVIDVPSNPQTTTTGSGFVAAGSSFSVTVQAQNAAGNITPNYGNENIAENVAVSLDSLVYPAGGVIGAINAANPFTPTANNGEFEHTALSWNEVGTIKLVADVADGDYLGTGLGAQTLLPSEDIGRFHPSHFTLEGEFINQLCDASGLATATFSYMSQPNLLLNYQLTARNVGGAVVNNYDDTDLNYQGTGAVTYHAENANDGINRTSRLLASQLDWDNGVMLLTDVPAQFDRIASPDGPFDALQLSMQVLDTDGATLEAAELNENPTGTGDCNTAGDCSAASIGSPLSVRFGRIAGENASGPETADLPVNFGVEFWNGTNFETTRDDSCSAIALTDIAFDSVSPAAPPHSVTVGTGTSVGTINNNTANALVMNGSFDLSFSAPNAVGEFPVSVDLTNYPWFRFDWNQDTDHNNDTQLPDIQIRFGSYRGHDRVIYWRERF